MCGNKGTPQPPLSRTPSAPYISIIQQSYKNPVVVWTPVVTFSDGRKLSLPGKVLYTVNINFGKRKIRTREHFLLDPLPISIGEKRCYSVKAIYEGYESKPSEPVCITGGQPPENVPRVKSIKAGDRYITISLEPEPEYSVEVFKNAALPYTEPFKTLPPGVSTFKDRNVKNGIGYTYRFRFSKNGIKGKLSKPVTVTPVDTVPPLPPGSPVMLRREKGCLVIWEPSSSPDVVGYRILIRGKQFSTERNRIYFYFSKCPTGDLFVVSVDESGNLSKPVKIKEVTDEEGRSNNGK
jgi:hypothetical protein